MSAEMWIIYISTICTRKHTHRDRVSKLKEGNMKEVREESRPKAEDRLSQRIDISGLVARPPHEKFQNHGYITDSQARRGGNPYGKKDGILKPLRRELGGRDFCSRRNKRCFSALTQRPFAHGPNSSGTHHNRRRLRPVFRCQYSARGVNIRLK